ncbi:MAG: hypothetical protein FWG14_11980 [Peptococcaceae bacterium]|nr:hypothetical protein [Peptococcaceae bacterium]
MADARDVDAPEVAARPGIGNPTPLFSYSLDLNHQVFKKKSKIMVTLDNGL